ncbi:MAG: hypothetical protein GX111_10540 [Clostridiales bacterium]|jgi:hypothetical protein|nr:hypothetical protein [Clostridiales bacterium]
MNLLLEEHLKKLNPTGIKWDDMTEEQKENLKRQWDQVVSVPRNMTCTCPRTFCENNHNCQFCITTHRSYGSLPDCLRIVDDKLSAEIPPEKRHNIHSHMNKNQNKAINREDYHNSIAAAVKQDPNAMEEGRKRAAIWHDLVRDPENTKCTCKKTDCRFHSNCTKCIALHRHFDGFPSCCESIHDNIACAILAYRAEQAEQAEP